ncbi:MAG TPA: 16S rRNA (cytidine(1402)-2'-O)-methyltransferase [Hellea balneolensis]|uniref:Ribosomal RNA small subunit methyltransferase I n=1 Tax=Hellea balneolensis TaxID=287478 RepID=A0A7C3C3B5_9PROT|nr:16S rRNA (cytidine(1402)-2'-O)-methyltransferase [Hellea balneolensis]
MLAIKPVSLAAGLYLVATPIGNLRDISLRALDTLASANLVLAEDTRVSRKLFSAYGLNTPLSAYHDHNAAKRVPNLVERMQAGEAIALISDAGTPLVSDPGYKLARACIDADIDVVAIPGASAVLSALVSSGLACDRFMFAGFLPPKSGARKKALDEVAQVPASLIFYESAGRLSATLGDMLGVFGDRPVVIARELTKKYEEILRGSLRGMAKDLATTKLRGEIVVLVGPPAHTEKWDEAAILHALEARIGELGVKRASEEIAALSGHKKRDVYTLALGLKRG